MAIQKYRGSALDSPGDNILAEFTSVVDAVRCALAVQKEIGADILEPFGSNIRVSE
jgi:adenylate cyclase